MTPREIHRLRWLRDQLRIAKSLYGVRETISRLMRIRRAERRGRRG